MFCDVTVISPLTHRGRPRPGMSNVGGRLSTRAQADNDNTYAAVIDSGLGSLLCLGFEVFGRWGKQCIRLIACPGQREVPRYPPSSASGNSPGLPTAMGRRDFCRAHESCCCCCHEGGGVRCRHDAPRTGAGSRRFTCRLSFFSQLVAVHRLAVRMSR